MAPPGRVRNAFTPMSQYDMTRELLHRTFASRSSGASFAGSYESATNLVRAMIGLNVGVFGLWYYANNTRNSSLLGTMERNFTVSINNFKEGRWWTLLTSAFSHQQPVHLLFNMIALNAFGSFIAITPGIGALHVVGMCFGSAIAGSVAFLYHKNQRNPDPKLKGWSDNVIRPQQLASGLGASGMVMGMSTVATCLWPTAPASFILIPISLPLWVFTLGYICADTYLLDSNSGIGHSAHLGGAIFGAAYYFAYLRGLGGLWQTVLRLGRR